MQAITLDDLRTVIREEIGGDGWLTAEQAAEYLGLAVGTVYNAVSQGRLPRRGDRGTSLRFRRADLDTYVEGRRSS